MEELDIGVLDAFFEQLLFSGLFYPLSDSQTRKLYSDFKVQTSQYSVHHFLFGMSGIIYLFDAAFWGIYPIEHAYAKLLNEISMMMRGYFEPTVFSFKPRNSKNGEPSIELVLELNDRRFVHQLNLLGDMVDLSLIGFINQILTELGENGRFYWVDTHDQIIATTFLTPQQYAIIKPRYNGHISPFEEHL